MESGTNFKVHSTPERSFVKVIGKASYLNCEPIRKFLDEQSKERDKRYVIDFSECTSMDSTFMGILVSIALKIRQSAQGGSIALLNLRGRNLDTICNLGIHQIAEISSENIANEAQLEDLLHSSDNSIANSETIYRAHKALMNLNDKNLKVFSDVVNYLEQKNQE